ncbi:hypothetical protein ACTA71_006296 [Dictyostelium dimigraforme]
MLLRNQQQQRQQQQQQHHQRHQQQQQQQDFNKEMVINKKERIQLLNEFIGDDNMDPIENKLKSTIDQFSTVSYYTQIYQFIKRIENNEGINDNGILKELEGLIQSPEQFLSDDSEDIMAYLNGVKGGEEQMFKSIKENISLINKRIDDLKNSKGLGSAVDELVFLLNKYIQSHETFMERVKKKFSNIPNTGKSHSIFKDSLPLIVGEDLEFRTINSMELADNIISYDRRLLDFNKKKDGSSCLGGFVDSTYCKVDNGSRVLRPAKEHAVYTIYKILFPNSSAETPLISPSKLLMVCGIKILIRDLGNEHFKKLFHKFEKLFQVQTEQLLQMFPKLKTDSQKILPPLNLAVQSALKVEGIDINQFIARFEKGEQKQDIQDEKLRKEMEEQITFDMDSLKVIDMESFGAHVLASFLLIQTDYKGDNLILEGKKYKIVGIDNDQSMLADEIYRKVGIVHSYIGPKNILFTFKPLMEKPIHSKIKEQFKKSHPNVSILKWLLAILEKESVYRKLVNLPFSLSGDLENSKNYFDDLELPFKFVKGWITKMLYRFHCIFSAIDIPLTYNDLFKRIQPIAYYYYQGLSKCYSSPVSQIASIYKDEYNIEKLLSLKKSEIFSSNKEYDDLLVKISNYKFTEDLLSLSITETIIELIGNSYSNDFKNSSPEFFVEWLQLVFNNDNKEINLFDHVNNSFKKDYLQCLLYLFKARASNDIIKTFIEKFGDGTLEKTEFVIIHTVINDYVPLKSSDKANSEDPYQDLYRQIKLLVELKANINLVSNRKTCLDLAAEKKLYNLFKLLIILGAGKSSDPITISNYYKTFSHEQKLDFKPMIQTLFDTDKSITWMIALNELAPSLSTNTINKYSHTLSTVIYGERSLSDEHWDVLLYPDGRVKEKKNKFGQRIVSFIQDDYGNGIYFKFNPQFPGVELAVVTLSEMLFGNGCSPYCELGLINKIPVLLIQQVEGDTLFEVFRDKNKRRRLIDENQIEKSSLSKVMVMEMLVNNSDGNLGNYIVNSTSNKIYSIDNDCSFMPSISKKLEGGQFKTSLQVETILFLLDEMNQPVHQDVIDCINKLNIYQECTIWLDSLNKHHLESLKRFNISNSPKGSFNETLVGFTFTQGMMRNLYIKLMRLKDALSKPNVENPDETTGPITHFQLLEILEPLIANRYAPLLNNANLSVTRKYSSIRKNLTIHTQTSPKHSTPPPPTPPPPPIPVQKDNNQQESDSNENEIEIENENEDETSAVLTLSKENFTSSSYKNNLLVESRGIPNIEKIKEDLCSGSFGPKQAILEIEEMKITYNNIREFIKELENGTIKRISEIHLEHLLKEAFFSNLSISHQTTLFRFLKTTELEAVHIKNISSGGESVSIDYSSHFRQLQFRLVTSIYLTGNKVIENINSGGVFPSTLLLPLLTHFCIKDCSKLVSLKINAPFLRVLNGPNCISLNDFDVTSPNMEQCNLQNGTIFSFDQINLKIKKFTKLKILNISNPRPTIIFPNNELEFSCFNQLKKLEAQKISSISKVTLNLPSLESLDLQHCENINQISIQSLFFKVLKLNETQKASSITMSIVDRKNEKPHATTHIESSNYLPLTQFYNRNTFYISDRILGSIPQTARSLVFYDGFNNNNEPIKPDSIPPCIEAIHLFDANQQAMSNIFKSIPDTVRELFIYSSCTIPQNLFPPSITTLHSINYQLDINSLQPNIRELHLHDGYKYGINHSDSKLGEAALEVLHLYDIEKEITNLPKSIKSLHLHDGYKFNPDLIKGMGIEYLHVRDIVNPLSSNQSLLSSVKELVVYPSYSHDLSLETSKINTLHLYNIKKPIKAGSLPPTLVWLEFMEGFEHPIEPGLIPEGVMSLSVRSIKQQLNSNLIPKSLKILNFYDLKAPLDESIKTIKGLFIILR